MSIIYSPLNKNSPPFQVSDPPGTVGSGLLARNVYRDIFYGPETDACWRSLLGRLRTPIALPNRLFVMNEFKKSRRLVLHRVRDMWKDCNTERIEFPCDDLERITTYSIRDEDMRPCKRVPQTIIKRKSQENEEYVTESWSDIKTQLAVVGCWDWVNNLK
jgi:hypothetical protein